MKIENGDLQFNIAEIEIINSIIDGRDVRPELANLNEITDQTKWCI